MFAEAELIAKIQVEHEKMILRLKSESILGQVRLKAVCFVLFL